MKISNFLNHPYLRLFFIALFCILIAINFFTISTKTVEQVKNLDKKFLEPGFEFAGLRKDLKGIPKAGYLSEKNQTAENQDGRFMMAQYMLAPTVLDLNNPNHRYLILDCTQPKAAIYLLEKTNAKPIAVTPFGKILAERKP
ncbi:MAG: hypothetical protein P9M07_03425 [Candidatus Aceula meridiana]|nr:hypothetical protein [Candidatus Aceula meridiana]